MFSSSEHPDSSAGFTAWSYKLSFATRALPREISEASGLEQSFELLKNLICLFTVISHHLEECFAVVLGHSTWDLLSGRKSKQK